MARKKRRSIVTTHSPKELLFGLNYTLKHDGKMTGIESISTSNLKNPRCLKRMKDKNLICHYCFSKKFQSFHPSLRKNLQENYDIMEDIYMISDDEIPFTPSCLFRFQSFGDLRNDYELEFYCKIAKKNPQTKFALWTKNADILEDYFVHSIFPFKPDNMHIVLSIPEINPENDPLTEYPWYIDHVFSVFTPEYAQEHNIEINCGDRCCLECKKCYSKDTPFYINELLNK